MTLCAVYKVDDRDFLFVKNLTRLYERLRGHREGMVDVGIFLGLFLHWPLALAQQDVVIPHVEAGPLVRSSYHAEKQVMKFENSSLS